eukprot:Mrub_06752.p4 GENE.Mrub_06752~~Mrub_06752.p4  ORF type:complete len:112 (-),score=3.40 Mrub_06752:11-346(-)
MTSKPTTTSAPRQADIVQIEKNGIKKFFNDSNENKLKDIYKNLNNCDDKIGLQECDYVYINEVHTGMGYRDYYGPPGTGNGSHFQISLILTSAHTPTQLIILDLTRGCGNC